MRGRVWIVMSGVAVDYKRHYVAFVEEKKFNSKDPVGNVLYFHNLLNEKHCLDHMRGRVRTVMIRTDLIFKDFKGIFTQHFSLFIVFNVKTIMF